jgi:hypothetical protein
LFLADVLVKENQRAEAMRWLKRAEKQGSLDAHQMLQVLKYTRHGHIFVGLCVFSLSLLCVTPSICRDTASSSMQCSLVTMWVMIYISFTYLSLYNCMIRR